MVTQVVMLEVVDYRGQYKHGRSTGFFGKVVHRVKVEDWTEEAIEAERVALRKRFGQQVAIIDIELVPEVGFRPRLPAPDTA